MGLDRKATVQEIKLIKLLVKNSYIKLSNNWENRLLVRPMDDGEMGSLTLFPNGKIVESRVFGEQIAEIQFIDLDGVEVIASLNIDSNGELFELDIWKTNFEKLLKFPDV